LKYKDGFDLREAQICNNDTQQCVVGVSPTFQNLGDVPFGSVVEIWLHKRWYIGILHCEIDKNFEQNDMIVLRQVKTWVYDKIEDHVCRLMVRASELSGMAVGRIGQGMDRHDFCSLRTLPLQLSTTYAVGTQLEIIAHDQVFSGVLWEKELAGEVSDETVVALREVKLWTSEGEKFYASRLFFQAREIMSMVPVKAFSVSAVVASSASAHPEFPIPSRRIVLLRIARDTQPLGLPSDLQWDVTADSDMLMNLSLFGAFGGYLSTQQNVRRVPSDRVHELLQLIEGDQFQLNTSSVSEDRIFFFFEKTILLFCFKVCL